MKHLNLILTFLIILPACHAADADTSRKSPVYDQPVLVTSVGQAADILIMKGLCKRAGLDAAIANLATSDNLPGYRTLILVAGGSSKGLGAAKVDVSNEESRVRKLIKAAHKAEIPVITFHIGGKARRGALSDPFNKLAAEDAELLVIAADGDFDGMFIKISEKKKSTYLHVEKTIDIIGVLKEKFDITAE